MVEHSVGSGDDLLKLHHALSTNNLQVLSANLLGDFFGNPLVASLLSLEVLHSDVVSSSHGLVNVDDAALAIFDQRNCRNVIHEGPVSRFHLSFLPLGKLQRFQHPVDGASQVTDFVPAAAIHPRRGVPATGNCGDAGAQVAEPGHHGLLKQQRDRDREHEARDSQRSDEI
jgi:hypothetical protein